MHLHAFDNSMQRALQQRWKEPFMSTTSRSPSCLPSDDCLLSPSSFSYDGQEAVLTGIESAITKQDSIITSYRDHCQHISRGGTIEEVMAELFGRATGATKGACLWTAHGVAGVTAEGPRP